MPNPAARKALPVTLHQMPRHWINFTTKSTNINWHSPTSASCWFAAPLEEGGDFFFQLDFDWEMRERWLPWLIFKFQTWLYFYLKVASRGWVGNSHRPSTQWMIIYRLVVFLTPPFITSFWASSIILDFRLWMIILIALASGEIGDLTDLTIFGILWSIWKPCCCAKLFLTLSRTKVVWNKRLTLQLAEIWVPSAEGKGKKTQNIFL